MDKQQLEKKLKEINTVIDLKGQKEEDIGIHSGLSGISLFKFYYSKFSNKEVYAEQGLNYLYKCLNKINTGYDFPTLCNGIAGFGWTVCHLSREGFLDSETNEILNDLDNYLEKNLELDMGRGNYDFLHGGIGYAYYFLERYRNSETEISKNKYRNIINNFLAELKELSVTDDKDCVKWLSIVNIETNEKGYNLSLSHGIASIIAFLTKLHEINDFKSTTLSVLKSAINYLIKVKNIDLTTSTSFFPNVIPLHGPVNKKSRLAWCYGDLGIAITLWNASKTLNNSEINQFSEKVLKNCTQRITSEDTSVVDAGICHGSYGNAQIFNRIYKETLNPIFLESCEFWINDGINRAIFSDGYAGYKQWHGKNHIWTPEISLLEGITGIGLVIMDYLSEYDFKWDECLMIS